jgi:ATP synthase protein I
VQNITKFSAGDMPMPKDDDSGSGNLASLGIEMGVGIGLGATVGYWVDSRFHTSPWGILIGCTLGFATGIYLLIKAAMKANKD